MSGGMVPERGYDFKSKREVDPARLQGELDRIYSAFSAISEYLSVVHDGDGSLRGSVIEARNLRSGVFRDELDEFIGRARGILSQQDMVSRSVQSFLLRSEEASKAARLSADEAGELLSLGQDVLDRAVRAMSDVNSGRGRAERAMGLASQEASSASSSASSARLSEDMSYRWAEKLDGPVFVPSGGDPVDDGFFSSKWWANYAESSVEGGSFWYLGPSATPPVEGNGGVPLLPGMWYFNTVDGVTYIWTGSSWEPISGSGGGTVQSVFGRVGNVVGEEGDYDEFYYTQAEVDAALSAHVSDVDNPHSTSWGNLLDIPSVFPPSAHAHVEADITDLDRVRPRGNFVLGSQYLKNDMALQSGYMGVALVDTEDNLAPLPQGDAAYVYDGASPTSAITAKSLLIGTEYTFPEAFIMKRYRLYTITGNEYVVYYNVDGGVTQTLISFTAGTTGWLEQATNEPIVAAGSVLNLGVVVREPDPTPTEFTLSYDYIKPNNPAIPLAGEVTHSTKSLDVLDINKTDQNGDQSAQLAGMEIGDIIETGGTRWSISAIVDRGTYYSFTVAPATQAAGLGVMDFNFETVTATPITTVIDADYFLGDANVQPFYVINNGARVETDDALGIDIELQSVIISPDWFIYAVSGASASSGDGGGGGVTTFRELSDTPASYAGASGRAAVVASDETALEYVDLDDRYLKAIDSGSVDFDTLVPASTQVQNYRITGVPAANGYPGAGVGDWLTAYAYSGTAARQVGHNWNAGSNEPVYYRDKVSGSWGPWTSVVPELPYHWGDEAPASPNVGDYWYCSLAGFAGLYVYTDDGDTTQWVQSNSGGADGVDGADGGAPDFDTGWQSSPSSNAATSIAHGLGGVPSRTECYLQVIEAVGGWSVGDVVPLSELRDADNSHRAYYGSDTTNLIFVYRGTSYGYLGDKAGGAAVVVRGNHFNWRIVAWV